MPAGTARQRARAIKFWSVPPRAIWARAADGRPRGPRPTGLPRRGTSDGGDRQNVPEGTGRLPRCPPAQRARAMYNYGLRARAYMRTCTSHRRSGSRWQRAAHSLVVLCLKPSRAYRRSTVYFCAASRACSPGAQGYQAGIWPLPDPFRRTACR